MDRSSGRSPAGGPAGGKVSGKSPTVTARSAPREIAGITYVKPFNVPKSGYKEKGDPSHRHPHWQYDTQTGETYMPRDKLEGLGKPSVLGPKKFREDGCLIKYDSAQENKAMRRALVNRAKFHDTSGLIGDRSVRDPKRYSPISKTFHSEKRGKTLLSTSNNQGISSSQTKIEHSRMRINQPIAPYRP